MATEPTNTLTLRAYKKKDLSKDNLGPDDLTYQGIKYRINAGKNIAITYVQGYKNAAKKTLFLDYATSQKIKRAFELLDRLEA